MKVLIIGASTAGSLCALELRKADKEIEIKILEKGQELQFSPCAMPYVLSGEIGDANQIRLMSEADYKNLDIEVMKDAEVEKIKCKERKVVLSNGKEESYDKLVVATGSKPKRPPIDIEDGSDVHFFKTLEDLSELVDIKSKDVAIIGAGLIGIETAHALKNRGKNVTIIESEDSILPNMMDPDMTKEIEDYILDDGVMIKKSASVSKIGKDHMIVDGENMKTESIIMATGFSPVLAIAENSGIETDVGIKTDRYMRTNEGDIFACGDCAESNHMITGETILSQLATTAYEQAKIVANNILGNKKKMRQILNSSVSKIGGKFFGSVGVTSSIAKKRGIEHVFSRYSSFNTAEYYARDSSFIVKLVADMKGKLIGAQFISDQNISGHLNMLSLAIRKRMDINDLVETETCYNPASNPLHDPIKMCAEILSKKLEMKKRRKG